MVEKTQAVVKVSELYQVCIVVRDLDKSMENYRKILGIEPWEIIKADPSNVTDMTYRGKRTQHKFRAAVAMAGPIQLELIEPIEGDNIYSDFLEQQGEGLHHLGHIRVDNIEETIRKLENEGFPCIQSGRFENGAYAYVDTTKALGTIIELLEMHEAEPAPFRK